MRSGLCFCAGCAFTRELGYVPRSLRHSGALNITKREIESFGIVHHLPHLVVYLPVN